MVAACPGEVERLEVVEPAASFSQLAGDTFVVGLHLTEDASRLSVMDHEGHSITEGCGPLTPAEMDDHFDTPASVRIVMEASDFTEPFARVLRLRGHKVLALDPKLICWLDQLPNFAGLPPARVLASFGLAVDDWEPSMERNDQDLGRAQLLLRSRYRMVRRYANLSSMTASVMEHYKEDGAFPLVVEPREGSSRYQVGMQGELDKALRSLADISAQIHRYDQEIEHLCQTVFPETAAVQQLARVGPAVALAYVVPLDVMEG